MSTSPSDKKAIGLNPANQTHYIDHLAPVCNLMKIPLLFIDERDYELGKKYYPGLNAQWQEYLELTPEFLLSNYDVIFMSDPWDQKIFSERYGFLEKEYDKILRVVHCPHGYSDKGFHLKKCVDEDITLVYGQNMLDMFSHYHILDRMRSYVLCGNYRYTYFKQYRAFYEKIVRNEILSFFDDTKKPLLLYAPTWLDIEESSTFFDAAQTLFDKLPEMFNMVVKLHPRLELDDTVQYYQIIGKYENKGNILFIKDFPPVYPLLAHTDLYIGDSSSIGYDFLAFDRPMFFLNKFRKKSEDQSALLYSCGVTIEPDDYPNIYSIIEKNSDQAKLSPIRKEMYNYTFGPERSFDDIRNDVWEKIKAE